MLETHTHADHVSGHGTLALELGVPVHVHAWPPASSTRTCRSTTAARCASATSSSSRGTRPGTAPSTRSSWSLDHTRADEPWLALTGDSLFVGDTARPDLAVAGDEGARVLYHSLHERLLSCRTASRSSPGHVAGSLCGRGMSAKPSTTIGFERRFNPMLRVEGEAAFVVEANRDLCPSRRTCRRSWRINRGPFLPRPPLPERLARRRAGRRPAARRARRATAYAAGHAPGALHAPASQTGFGNRVGWLLGADDEPVLVAADEARGAARRAAAAGRGLPAPGAAGWRRSRSGTAEAFAVLELDELVAGARDGSLQVVDVREPTETPAPLPGAHQMPLRLVAGDDLGGLDPAQPTAVVCGAGSRAAMGAALLARRGFTDVRPVLVGGMSRVPAGVA